MRRVIAASLFLAGVCAVLASPQQDLPQFGEYPEKVWDGQSAPVKLATASERLFRTNLTNAAKQPANFAGHYRFTFWGCGSFCGAGALIDLQTGVVYPPPLGEHGDGWERWIIGTPPTSDRPIEFRLDNKLVIIRGGINYSERLKANVADVWYFLWEAGRFRQLLFIPGKDAGR